MLPFPFISTAFSESHKFRVPVLERAPPTNEYAAKTRKHCLITATSCLGKFSLRGTRWNFLSSATCNGNCNVFAAVLIPNCVSVHSFLNSERSNILINFTANLYTRRAYSFRPLKFIHFTPTWTIWKSGARCFNSNRGWLFSATSSRIFTTAN